MPIDNKEWLFKWLPREKVYVMAWRRVRNYQAVSANVQHDDRGEMKKGRNSFCNWFALKIG